MVIFQSKKMEKKSLIIKGSEREKQIQNHESMGNKMLIYSFLIVLLAFISNIFRGIIDFNSPTHYLIRTFPRLVRYFRPNYDVRTLESRSEKTSVARKSGLSFHRQKELHGKVSDILAMLIVIHSF